MDILFAIIAFLIAISVVVAFHEFGHFWVARRCGVRVLRFSIGFGKPLWRIVDKHQTEFVISAIPLGGYVKMLDEREGPVSPEQRHQSFNGKSVWVRFSIVIAGPLFNFIFAVLAYWFMFIIGVDGWLPQIGEIKPDSIAAHAGMVAGEEIIAVDKYPTKTWQHVLRKLVVRVGDKGILELETAPKEGLTKTYFLDLTSWELKGDAPNLIKDLGIVLYQPPIPAVIKKVIGGESAQKAGILVGDKIIRINTKAINEWKDFTEIVLNSPHQPLEITVKRGDSEVTVNLTPRLVESNTGEITGYVGVVVETIDMPKHMLRRVQFGVIEAFVAACKKTYQFIVLTFQVIGKMVIGEMGLQTISGPLTIAQVAYDSAHIGFPYYLSFLGLISISLGVINILPIPLLDGGHLLYYVIEILTRKPVSDRVQVVGFKIGMVFLILLMSVAFYNDLARMF